jgi:hypothetical protein
MMQLDIHADCADLHTKKTRQRERTVIRFAGPPLIMRSVTGVSLRHFFLRIVVHLKSYGQYNLYIHHSNQNYLTD